MLHLRWFKRPLQNQTNTLNTSFNHLFYMVNIILCMSKTWHSVFTFVPLYYKKFIRIKLPKLAWAWRFSFQLGHFKDSSWTFINTPCLWQLTVLLKLCIACIRACGFYLPAHGKTTKSPCKENYRTKIESKNKAILGDHIKVTFDWHSRDSKMEHNKKKLQFMIKDAKFSLFYVVKMRKIC